MTVEIASEWRSSEPALGPRDVVLGVTQSGETRDTLAALDLARRFGRATAAVTNVEGSQVCSQANLVFFTHAGPEIGVAATKTFTCQAALFAALAIQLGRTRGTMTDDAADTLTAELAALPGLVGDSITLTAEVPRPWRGRFAYLFQEAAR